MTDLAAFLLARIDEDEVAARRAARGGSGRWGSWNRSWDAEPYRDLADEDAGERIARLGIDIDEHIARHDPARVLAECEAKRRIVNRCLTLNEQAEQLAAESGTTRASFDGQALAWRVAVRFLAEAHADHPDYDQAWRP